MEGRQLLQYIIDTSDVVLAKKQEATEYLAKIEKAAQQSVQPTGGTVAPAGVDQHPEADTAPENNQRPATSG